MNCYSFAVAHINRLHAFFRREIEDEVARGFPRLSRIPSSFTVGELERFNALIADEQRECIDYCAFWACACYGFVVGMPRVDPTKHPFFHRWRRTNELMPIIDYRRSVPTMRAIIQQRKIDQKRGVPSRVSDVDFAYAQSVEPVLTAELRKRVRAALKQLGYRRVGQLGDYCCELDGRPFAVHMDFGGSTAQLRYSVALPEFAFHHPLLQFCFEQAMGFGNGDWDYIVKDNVDSSIDLLIDLVRYCLDLPDRIRSEVF